jgi:hypothetical protein
VTARLAFLLAQTAPSSSSDAQFVEGDLSSRGHIFIAIVTAIALLFILRLVRRRQLSGKYALLWIVVACCLGVLAVWPGLLTSVSEFVGVHYPPALFLLVTTGFLFVVVIQFSYELSRLEDRSRTLAEETALLRAELDAALDRLDPDRLDPDRATRPLVDDTADDT